MYMIPNVAVKRTQSYPNHNLKPFHKVQKRTNPFVIIAQSASRSTKKLDVYKLTADKWVFLTQTQVVNTSRIEIGTLISCIGVVIYDPTTKITFALHASPCGSIEELKNAINLMLKNHRIPAKRIKVGLFYNEHIKTYEKKMEDLTKKKHDAISSYLKLVGIKAKTEILKPADFWVMNFYPKTGTWSAKSLFGQPSKPRTL